MDNLNQEDNLINKPESDDTSHQQNVSQEETVEEQTPTNKTIRIGCLDILPCSICSGLYGFITIKYSLMITTEKHHFLCVMVIQNKQ